MTTDLPTLTVPEILALIQTTWKPRGDRILVMPLIKAERSAAGLITTDENRDLPERGLVLRVGRGGVAPESGRPIPVESREGDFVVFGKYTGLPVELPIAQGRILCYLMQDALVDGSLDADQVGRLVIHDNDPRRVHEPNAICEHCPTGYGTEALAAREELLAQQQAPDAPPAAPGLDTYPQA